MFAVVLPNGFHRQAVFADGNAQIQCLTGFRNRFDGAVEFFVFAFVAARRHPVGGKLDVADVADVDRRDVGDGFADAHSARGGCVKQGNSRFFAHRHRFAAIGVEAHHGNGAVGYWSLVFADHLVAVGHAADAAVADGNQEVFSGYGRQAQNAVGGFGDVDVFGSEWFFRRPHGFVAARGFGRFAEQDVQRQIDGVVGEQIVAYFQMAVVGCRADHGKRAAFAFADGAEGVQIFFQNRQHITLLRFVAPDLQRVEAVFFQRHFA